MGGLSEMSRKYDSVGLSAKKIKMAEILGWVKNPFFLPQKFKKFDFSKKSSLFCSAK
jgi:hypothetical protein